MNCKVCKKQVELRVGWRAVFFRCTACGRDFSIKEYTDEIDDETWERISRRPCNRAWNFYQSVNIVEVIASKTKHSPWNETRWPRISRSDHK